MSDESVSKVVLPDTDLHHLTSHSVPDQTFEISVCLPPSYSISPEKRYPVLYLLDGDFCLGMAIDVANYLRIGEYIPEILIVGVGYGSQLPPDKGGSNMRSRDFWPFSTESGTESGGEAFRLFLEQELVPFIDSTYRSDPSKRALYGFSLGGLFGLHALFRDPALLNAYILVSPTLMPTTDNILEQAEQFVNSHSDCHAKVYLCTGEFEFNVSRFKRLIDTFTKGHLASFYVEWETYPRGVHFTMPAEALAKGLRAIFGMKSLFEAAFSAYQKGGVNATINLYHELKDKHAAEYDFSQRELNELGYELLYNDKVEDAIEVLKLNVAAYPEDWNPYDSLGEAYMVAGRAALAIENYEKSVELNPKNAGGVAQLKKLKSATESH